MFGEMVPTKFVKPRYREIRPDTPRRVAGGGREGRHIAEIGNHREGKQGKRQAGRLS